MNFLSPASPLSKTRQALLSIAFGTPDEAMNLLSSAADDHEAELVWLASDPRYDTLRTDDRFARVQEKVALNSL
jgi:hypothetical protein